MVIEMRSTIERLLAAGQLSPKLILRGLEKENLRLDQAGRLSHRPHPKALGAKQTHPHITTDFAEAQMEIVSGVHRSVASLCAEFEALYQFIYPRLEQELLWPYSMPCMTDPAEITPAYYGKNNAAKMKHVYRRGLILRYGKAMQIICGIHYNFSLDERVFDYLRKEEGSKLSLQDYVSARYMGLIRNYFRWYWLLPYLFGASPLVMKSSLSKQIPECLVNWDHQAFYAPHATSLRMTRIGYQNNTQSGLKICHNTIEAYGNSLLAATQIPYDVFEALGVIDAEGQYQQLNANILQIENEYYSPIRPKRVTRPGERPATALLSRGIEYIEIRVSDLNPLLPLGLAPEQLKFMDVFLLFCLLNDSPQFAAGELTRHRQNFNLVALHGRNPDLRLQTETGVRAFREWAETLFAEMQPLAAALDGVEAEGYQAALAIQMAKLSQTELLPSDQIMQGLHDTGLCLNNFMMKQAALHRDWFMRQTSSFDPVIYGQQIAESERAWQALEAEPSISFNEYLANYFAQGVVCDPRRLCY